jgi:hypothetical protein
LFYYIARDITPKLRVFPANLQQTTALYPNPFPHRPVWYVLRSRCKRRDNVAESAQAAVDGQCFLWRENPVSDGILLLNATRKHEHDDASSPSGGCTRIS